MTTPRFVSQSKQYISFPASGIESSLTLLHEGHTSNSLASKSDADQKHELHNIKFTCFEILLSSLSAPFFIIVAVVDVVVIIFNHASPKSHEQYSRQSIDRSTPKNRIGNYYMFLHGYSHESLCDQCRQLLERRFVIQLTILIVLINNHSLFNFKTQMNFPKVAVNDTQKKGHYGIAPKKPVVRIGGSK